MTDRQRTPRIVPARGRPAGSLLASLLLVLLTSAVAGTAGAASQVDVLDFADPDQEARYRVLIDEFRCPKCLNTNLSGSDAPIARDLRNTVHRLIVVEGYSDDQIRAFLQERYGDFVLYDPPFKPGTWALWLLPVLFVLLGLWVLIRMLKPRAPVALTETDRSRVRRILDELEQ